MCKEVRNEIKQIVMPGAIANEKGNQMIRHLLLTLGIMTVSSSALAGEIANTLINADYPQPSGSCSVSAQQFSTWKKNPANPQSLNFVPANSANFTAPLGDCSFYQWGAQMFLWLTSPEPTGNYVFLGKNFSNVIGFDANGNPIFAANDVTSPNNITASKVFNLRTGQGVLKNTTNIPFTGEAGTNHVTMAQGGSLVYYAMHVNDVYVALQNNQANVKYFPALQNFPVTARQVANIASASKTKFPDAQAMSMELKTAWIDAATVPPAVLSTMLTIQGSVPNFVPANNTLVFDGKTYVTKKLALVGMHLVATVKGHPEMVWATFEHFMNAPNNTFTVTASGGGNVTVPFNQNGPSMTFFASGTPIASANPTTLTAAPGANPNAVTITSSTGTIGPVSSVRLNPWGNVQTNASAATISNNTQLLNLALSLENDLSPAGAAGISRAAYIQSGAVWTVGGVIPTAKPGTVSGQPTLAGSPVLANTTMETFFQASNSKNAAPGCFGCHFANPPAQGQLVQGVGVSHVFNDQLTPAPTSGKTRKHK